MEKDASIEKSRFFSVNAQILATVLLYTELYITSFIIIRLTVYFM